MAHYIHPRTLFQFSLAIFILSTLCPLSSSQDNSGIEFLGQLPFRAYTPRASLPLRTLYQFFAVHTPDSNSSGIHYSILQGEDLGGVNFFVESETGRLSNGNYFPQSGPDTYELIVEAKSEISNRTISACANLTVVVVPESETAPRYEHGEYELEVSEGTEVGSPLVPTRAFSLNPASALVRYSIIGGNTDGDFMIDSCTGLLTVMRGLDRERTDAYVITVHYVDDFSSIDTMVSITIIDENDNPPQFVEILYNITIPEDTSVNTNILNVSAVDPDLGENGMVSYTLDSTVSSTFSLDPLTGELQTLTPIDYEIQRQYQFKVTAVDGGMPSRSSDATVFVNIANDDDECPRFESSVFITELPYDPDIMTQSAVLLTVVATDPDKLSSVVYRIISGNEDGVLELNEQTGEITIATLDGDPRGQYNMNVSASDASCVNQSFVSVKVGIGNANEHSPSFEGECKADLPENPPVGTLIVTLRATDGDNGSNGEVRYSLITCTNLFTIDAESGEVRTKSSPESYNRENQALFHVGVIAMDGGNRQDYCLLTISLQDVNDNAPTFHLDQYNTTLSVNADPNTVVLEVHAEDSDQMKDGTVEYSLSYPEGLPPHPFAISSETGVITTTGTPIDQSLSCLLFHVIATDNGSPSLSSSIAVKITLTSDNNHPIFQQPSYSTVVGENAMLSTTVDTVVANSSVMQPVIYEALNGIDYQSNRDGIFRVGSNGDIIVTSLGIVDFERLPHGKESFFFYVSAMNSFGNSLALVEVNITDVNDNPPDFPFSNLQVSITENEPASTVVIQIQASDPDNGTNGEIAYRLLEGSAPYYDLDSANGIVTSNVIFDAENSTMSSSNDNALFIEAYNPGPNGETPGTIRTLVSVSIIDINDNPPSFDMPSYSIVHAENLPIKSTVLKLEATDPDSSDEGQLSYFIVDGNTGVTFELDSTGQLILGQRLDYESTTDYLLTVGVSDGLHRDTTTVNITITDIDDEPPAFSLPSYSAQVIENSPLGSFVCAIEATDLDSENIVYSLQGSAVGRFSVDSNGTITVSGAIDREEFPSGTVNFLAFAESGRLAAVDIEVKIIDLNDYFPRFLQPLNGRVEENTAPSDDGLFVVRVQATDLDEGENGTVTYYLLSGEEEGFQIDPWSGNITAHREFDRETTATFTLTVLASDNGTAVRLNSTAKVVVDIGDVNDNGPSFPYPYMFTRVFEDSPVGTPVISVPAFDPDNGENASITFILVSMLPPEVKYSLSPSAGEVTVNGFLDYETLTHRLFTLTIALKNADFLSEIQAVLEIQLLDRNDRPPQLADPVYPIGQQIPENIPAEVVVAQLSATDEDSGSNGEIEYIIVAGDPNGDFRLTVEEGMGVITAVKLDRELRSSYTLEVVVADRGCPVQSTSVELSFTIMDVNDVPPMFNEDTYTASITENTGPISSILQVNATDPDTGSGGRIDHYAIASGNVGERFVLNSTTGVLSSTVMFDREERSSYQLTILAVDGGGVPQVGTGTVVVTISDVNDNPSMNGGEMKLHVVAPGGQLPAGLTVPIYFDDPDTDDTFEFCNVFIDRPGNEFIVDMATCLIAIPTNPLEGVIDKSVTGNDGFYPPVRTTIAITVEHLPESLLLSESCITISVHKSTASFLRSSLSTFPTVLASVLGVSNTEIVVISVQPGYHDTATMTDITFSAQKDGSFLRQTAIIQDLYLQRDLFLNSGFPLYALPTDPCTMEPCVNQAACVSLRPIGEAEVVASSGDVVFVSPRVNLSYECECVPGTSGENCEINYADCYSNPCLYDALCTDGVNGFVCDCPEGTSGRDCSFNPDECVSNPCQNGATCRNGLGTHVCDCPLGFYGTECQYQYFQPSSICTPNPCLNGAECSPGRDSFSCLCPDNFTGSHCEVETLVQGGCIGNPCYNGSTCTDTGSGYSCTCSVGFTGPNCRWPLNNCELEPCKNGGSCLAGFYGSYRCICPAGFTGEDCSDVVPACDATPCSNGGRCTDTEGGLYTCECTRKYSGMDCTFPLRTEDLCDSNPCHPSGNCTSGREGFTCTCFTNFTGSDCSIASTDIALCGSNPCQHGGTCSVNETSAEYSCVCSLGFEGENCEINIDDCNPNPCMNGGECEDVIGGFICDCPDHITGRICDIFCPYGHQGEFCEIPPNYCDPSHCQNNGTCTESEEPPGFVCSCPPGYTGQMCDTEKQCQCLNGGICVSSSAQCVCGNGFDGENCELLVASFSGSQTQSSYRAFNSLEIKGEGSLSFQFSTLDSNALLLYNTQYQSGGSWDYLAVAIVGGKLEVSVSHGEGSEAVVTVMSGTASLVNDGLWHDVSIQSSGKSVRVLLDYCHQLQEGLLDFVDCTAITTTTGNRSFFDFGLPLWVGGVPFTPSPPHPITSQGMTGCIRELTVDGKIMDLEGYVYELNSQQGCPQLESNCSASQCGGGTCDPVWNGFRCVCPPLVAGDNCEETAISLTFSGDNYAQYIVNPNWRTRQLGVPYSSFEEQISLQFRSQEKEGILFYMGAEENTDFIALQVQSGELLYRVNLGSNEGELRVTGVTVSNNSWHTVDVSRSGLQITLTLDGRSFSHTLSGTELTLDILSSAIYAAGRPGNTAQGFTGCLQDLRLNQYVLPTSGSNAFASVEFIGTSDIITGCYIGPCVPHPCGVGQCQEFDGDTFTCHCPDGSVLFTACSETTPSRGITWAIIVAAIVGAILVVVIMLIVMCLWRYHWKRKRARRYVIDNNIDKPEGNTLFSPEQCMVISNEPGGGEEDTAIDWSEVEPTKENLLRMEPPEDSPASSIDIPRAEISPPTPPVLVRANSPTIKAFIEQQVRQADEEVPDIDSVRCFNEEGQRSPAESLSSICSSCDDEPYTLEQLKRAGEKFSKLAELLEGILVEEDYLESTSEVTNTTQHSATEL